jgi:hypothetical protein
MYANTPWSGHYNVQSTIWVTAHATQFAKPGWTYTDTASGYLPEGDGSYVSLRAPASNTPADWSVVLETITPKVPQHIVLHIGENLAAGEVYVWQTNSNRVFEKVATLSVRRGVVEYDFDPDSIYSITTMTGQGKGTVQPPSDSPFPLPYSDDFDRTIVGRSPKYLADQDGAFE